VHIPYWRREKGRGERERAGEDERDSSGI